MTPVYITIEYKYYCTKCGGQLKEVKRIQKEFSSKSGKPIYKVYYRCPNWKHYFDGHTRRIETEFGIRGKQ